MTDKKMPGPRPGAPSPAPEEAAELAGELAAKGPDRAGDAPAVAEPPEGGEGTAARSRKRAANVKDHIGRQLRALYNEVASQPVPDRFMELLNRLDVKSGEE
jgi:hypothetical protein